MQLSDETSRIWPTKARLFFSFWLKKIPFSALNSIKFPCTRLTRFERLFHCPWFFFYFFSFANGAKKRKHVFAASEKAYVNIFGASFKDLPFIQQSEWKDGTKRDKNCGWYWLLSHSERFHKSKNFTLGKGSSSSSRILKLSFQTGTAEWISDKFTEYAASDGSSKICVPSSNFHICSGDKIWWCKTKFSSCDCCS